MTTISVTQARADLYHLVDQVQVGSEPVVITGKRGNAVLIAQDDWEAIQETLYLTSIPGYLESIRQARAEGIESGTEELDW